MTLTNDDIKKIIQSAKNILKIFDENEDATKNFLRNALNLSLNSTDYDDFLIRFKYLIARKTDKNFNGKMIAMHFEKEFENHNRNMEHISKIMEYLVMLHYAKEEEI